MTFDINRLQDADVVDQTGDKIGSVGQVYVDDQTNEPSFVTVKTGLFGGKETFVPLHAAQQTERGIEVPYTKDFVKDAPQVDADGHISEQEESEIERYYGEGTGFGGRDAGYDQGAAGAAGTAGLAGERHDERGTVDAGRQYADTESRDSGEGMVRHEEELRVGKERVETGRVRLRKHVVTEHKTITVPVEREEFEVVREPITDGQTGGHLGDDEQVVTLSEERPVVEKEVVAKERIGLQTHNVTEQQQVQAEVGREEISVERDGGRGVTDGGRTGTVEGDDRSFMDKAKDAITGDDKDRR